MLVYVILWHGLRVLVLSVGVWVIHFFQESLCGLVIISGQDGPDV